MQRRLPNLYQSHPITTKNRVVVRPVVRVWRLGKVDVVNEWATFDTA